MWLLVSASCLAAASVEAAPRTRTASPPHDLLQDHPLVVDIAVRGLDSVTTHAILRVLETEVGKPFDATTFRRDMEAVAALGYFDVLDQRAEYEPVPGGIRIVLHLRENPRVRDIALLGHIRFTEKQLRAELPVLPGDTLRTRTESDIRRSLGSFYRDGGHSRVRITVRRLPVEPGWIDLSVYIDEGERLKIEDMILEGNDSYPAWWIVPRLVNHGSWFLFSNYYDDELLQSDIETVRGFYIDRGFLDVRVRAGRPRPGSKPGRINPVIVIEEGRRYRVSSVEVRGHTLFTTPEVYAPFRRLVGKTYDGERLRAAIGQLRDLYGNEGFIDAEVEIETLADPEAGTVAIALRLTEGQVVYVGQPRVEMNVYEPGEDLTFIERFFNWMAPPTKEKTVLREVRLKPGEKYRRSDEVRTVERLRRLQIFESVTVHRETTDDPAVRDPVVEVEEKSVAGFVGMAVGYGDVTGAALTLSYINPNIAGEAKVLRASATFGQYGRRYRVSYLNRYWMGTDNSLELAGYRYEDHLEGYRQKILGASGEVGHPVSEYLTAWMRLRLEDVRFRRRHPERVEPLDNYGTVAARAVLEWDRRDDVVWPTRGFRVSGGFEAGHADGPLFKVLHGFGHYRRLAGDVVWAYEHDFGLIPYRSDRVGITERFFLGGSNDLRGFRARGASPVDSGYRRLRVGGSTKFVQRNEVRFPIAGPLKGRVFVDDGFLDERPWRFGQPRVSSGLGFMVDLRVVNLEIDFARALVYKKTDARRLLHFRIASRF